MEDLTFLPDSEEHDTEDEGSETTTMNQEKLEADLATANTRIAELEEAQANHKSDLLAAQATATEINENLESQLEAANDKISELEAAEQGRRKAELIGRVHHTERLLGRDETVFDDNTSVESIRATHDAVYNDLLQNGAAAAPAEPIDTQPRELEAGEVKELTGSVLAAVQWKSGN